MFIPNMNLSGSQEDTKVSPVKNSANKDLNAEMDESASKSPFKKEIKSTEVGSDEEASDDFPKRRSRRSG